jgi:CTP:molybdopterin cytidylyltransferase MocA
MSDAVPDPRAQPVLILAAGHGTRMGGPKAFARLDGETFLERILARVREAACPAILAVDPAHRSRIEAVLAAIPPLPVRVVEADGTLPMLASVQAAIGALDGTAQGAWVWPVDAPLLSSPGWLKARAAVAQRDDVVLKLSAGGRTGHPVWFPRWACMAILASSWDEGLMGFLAEVPGDRIVILDLPGEVLSDFNTPEQLASHRI